MTTILVSVGINLVLMGFFYIILSKKAAQRKEAPEILEQIRTELDQMVVELNRTADRNIGLVEERLRSLNQLIGEADRRVSILKKETDKYTRNAGTYSNVRPIQLDLGSKPGSSGSSGRPGSPDRTGNPGQKNSKEEDHGVIGTRPEKEHVEQAPAELPSKKKETAGTGLPGKRERVMELYRQGISPEIIASRLDSTVAEVELIISMTGADR